MRKLIGKMIYPDTALFSLHVDNTRPGGKQQLGCGAPDGSRALSRAIPQIEEMRLRMMPKYYARVTWLDSTELLSAVSLCPNFRALDLKWRSTHFELDALRPLKRLAMLSRINLNLGDGGTAPTLVWSLSGLLQLLPFGQTILLYGPVLAIDLFKPALFPPHPLQHLSHVAGNGSCFPEVICFSHNFGEAGWGDLQKLKVLRVDLDDYGLQQVCDSLFALESLKVQVASPKSLKCISSMSCLTSLFLASSNDCRPGELSALTKLKRLYLYGRFSESPAGLSCAAQLTKLSMRALVPGVDGCVMSLTALQTLELGNYDGAPAVDANHRVARTQPLPMDLRALELDGLKHLRSLGLYGCSFSLSSRFLSVCQHSSLQQIYLEDCCPGDSESLECFLALAACVANGGTRFSIAMCVSENYLGRQTAEARECILSLDISYDQITNAGKLIRFVWFLEALLGSDLLSSYIDFSCDDT